MKAKRCFYVLIGLAVLLSGSSSANAGFVDNGNGTISDTGTELMWQKDTARDGDGNYDSMTWEEALSYCEENTLAGFDDWRLPTIKELNSIVDYEKYPPGINTTYFPNTTSGAYWSSTTNGHQSNYAFTIPLIGGSIYYNDKLNPISRIYVRAVRWGSTTVPAVATAALANITSNSATGGGNVTSDGGASITARGVCWSTSANPTTSNSTTTDGSGTGSFTSAITGLSSGTLYHVKAYAVNSVGTAYGNDLTFTTSNALYVSSNGNCGTKNPCYDSIQEAIQDAATGSVIHVKQGTYAESLSLESAKTLLIKGGYNTIEYDQQTANTTFIQAPGPTNIQALSGSLKFQMINVK